MDFEINIPSRFFYMTKKSRQNTKISWEQKELLRWNKNPFSSILKAFSYQKLSQILECTFPIKTFFFWYIEAYIFAISQFRA